MIAPPVMPNEQALLAWIAKLARSVSGFSSFQIRSAMSREMRVLKDLKALQEGARVLKVWIESATGRGKGHSSSCFVTSCLAGVCC